MKKQILTVIAAAIILNGCSGQNQKKELTDTEMRLYSDNGKQIAKATFEVLSGQLTQALARGGVAEAASYCNLKAYPMVDSLSTAHRAYIKRATIWTRNPKDKANAEEERIINEYLALKSVNKPLNPVVRRDKAGDIQFYMPIQIGTELCLNCHGSTATDIKAGDLEIIKKLYPEDQATGHKMGDLRGIWSITFSQK